MRRRGPNPSSNSSTSDGLHTAVLLQLRRFRSPPRLHAFKLDCAQVRRWALANHLAHFTGSKIYEREMLLSYFDFLPAAFLAHGRPLQIYVDYHSLFFTHDPDALTQLG